MRIFDIFYFVCIAGMVLAFFGPQLTHFNVPNIFDRYRYLLKHKFECNIRINGTGADEDEEQDERQDNAVVTLGTESSRPSPDQQVSEFAKDLVHQLKSAPGSQQRTPAADSLLRDTVDKIFKNKSLHKSLSKQLKNLNEHSSFKSMVDKISEKASAGQGLSTMQDVAKAVNTIFKEVHDLEDENSDVGMRKIFEQINDHEDSDDDCSSSE